MGEVKDEVIRTNVTNAEIKILRSIHGEDAVLDVVATGEDAMTSYTRFDDEGNSSGMTRPRSEDEERSRLEIFYGESAVARLFGVSRPSIADEPASMGDAIGVAIPLETPVRAEVKPLRAPTKALVLEDVG